MQATSPAGPQPRHARAPVLVHRDAAHVVVRRRRHRDRLRSRVEAVLAAGREHRREALGEGVTDGLARVEEGAAAGAQRGPQQPRHDVARRSSAFAAAPSSRRRPSSSTSRHPRRAGPPSAAASGRRPRRAPSGGTARTRGRPAARPRAHASARPSPVASAGFVVRAKSGRCRRSRARPRARGAARARRPRGARERRRRGRRPSPARSASARSKTPRPLGRAAPGPAPARSRRPSRRARAGCARDSAPPRARGRGGRPRRGRSARRVASSRSMRPGPSSVSSPTVRGCRQLARDGERVGRVQRGRVARPHRGGDPTLRPGAVARFASGPLASRSTRRPGRPSATDRPATPAPRTTTSASRTASSRALIGRPRARPPACARPRAARAPPPPARPRPRCSSVCRARRIFGSVIRFMCGQRLHGRTNSVSGKLDRDVVAHRALGDQHHAPRPRGLEVADHAGRRADVVGRGEHVRRALGVAEHRHLRVLPPERRDLGAREALVHLAVPLPQDELRLRLRGHVAAEVLVRQEDHARHAERLDHLDGVRRRAADVRLGLDLGRGVDVGDDRGIRVALAQQPHVGGR